ncbi:MAG: thiamine-phosphate kinase [Desulfobulbaceae bacterium]|jgi:thiamine-monophosphate kinase|nr:thiamine-phosphate kinase [Desulfobulbaceae bacterium]
MAELEFIDFIARHKFVTPAADLQLSIGDDCAVVKKDSTTSLLYTMDSLVAQVHFDLRFHPAHLLGRKALGVNISDIAGMGGRPKFALLSMCLPVSFSEPSQQEFMAGFFSMCDEFGVILIGGDTVSGDSLNISVTLIGEAETPAICTRSGAGVGDEIWVSGSLGNSAIGLGLLQTGQDSGFPELVTAHLDPRPQVALGQMLAGSGRVTSMMDISDGVATDLAHICRQSSCGAVVHGSRVPISAMMMEGAALLGLNPLHQSLVGGEDYQLLFTVPAGQGTLLAQQVKAELGLVLSRIGVIDCGQGVRLQDGEQISEISFQGYEHK